jgi:hypothetical protein
MIESTVTFGGPWFDGRADDAVKDFLLDARKQVADQALAEVHQILNADIKFPTPYYETQIIHQTFANADVVHDRDIIYGPWLEGTSQRNLTTRFKGYHSFRRATQKVESLLDTFLKSVLARYIGRMN